MKEAGHQRARQRFHWPLMEKDVNRWSEQWQRNILYKTSVSRPFAELVPFLPSRPMEPVCIDFAGGFGKKICVRKPGNTCASPTAMI